MRHKNEVARRALEEGPDLPDPVAYLYGWSSELLGRSGVNDSGFNPLSYTTIKHWAELTGRRPSPHEVDALLVLDGVRRHPPDEE